MSRLQLVRTTATLCIALVVLSNIPYMLLIQTFEYDDILREPVETVLTQFHAGGTKLILIWFAFGLAALLFIPVSMLLQEVINSPTHRERKEIPYLTTATMMGALSGILQAVGLMRWVFVVPVLANIYTDPTTTITTREVVGVVYQSVHQYGGVVIGEHLGQTLMIGWTLGVGNAMRQSLLFKPWVAWWGLLTTPLLLLGQSELFKTAIPTMPVVEATPVGFILWEVWLLIVGISLLGVPPKRLAS